MTSYVFYYRSDAGVNCEGMKENKQTSKQKVIQADDAKSIDGKHLPPCLYLQLTEWFYDKRRSAGWKVPFRLKPTRSKAATDEKTGEQTRTHLHNRPLL